MFEDDELSYSVGDLLFRIGNCPWVRKGNMTKR